MGQQSFFSEADKKKTQSAVEDALEKYRRLKYLTLDDREASTTASYSERFHGPTNQTSDQTANIAIHNVDAAIYRKEYCERVENAVQRMPRVERFLMEKRYLTIEHDYITDQSVYNFEFEPPISEPTYSKYRWRAFLKLAEKLNIVVEKDDTKEG